MVSVDKPDDADHVLSGKAQTSAYLGDRSHLHFQVDGLEQTVSVASPNLRPLSGRIQTAEQSCWLSWPAEAVILLPPE